MSRVATVCGAVLLVSLCLALSGPERAWARTGAWDALVERLVRDGHDRATVQSLFDRLGESAYSPETMGRKLRALYARKFPPPKKRTGPAKRAATPDRPRVYKHCLGAERVREAKSFLYGNHFLLNRFVERWSVPRELAVAILSVETRLGRVLGKVPAVATLASMAATDRWEQVAPLLGGRRPGATQRKWLKRRQAAKTEWAYKELTALLEHARNNGLDLLAVPGSPYGAIGMCQFMPSNAVRFGVDGNGDGRVDLYSRADALHSMGRFLRANGWKGHMSDRGVRKVLYRYNHSSTYINTVLALARRLRGDGS